MVNKQSANQRRWINIRRINAVESTAESIATVPVYEFTDGSNKESATQHSAYESTSESTDECPDESTSTTNTQTNPLRQNSHRIYLQIQQKIHQRIIQRCSHWCTRPSVQRSIHGFSLVMVSYNHELNTCRVNILKVSWYYSLLH